MYRKILSLIHRRLLIYIPYYPVYGILQRKLTSVPSRSCPPLPLDELDPDKLLPVLTLSVCTPFQDVPPFRFCLHTFPLSCSSQTPFTKTHRSHIRYSSSHHQPFDHNPVLIGILSVFKYKVIIRYVLVTPRVVVTVLVPTRSLLM